jgi:hypothetical protein
MFTLLFTGTTKEGGTKAKENTPVPSENKVHIFLRTYYSLYIPKNVFHLVVQGAVR